MRFISVNFMQMVGLKEKIEDFGCHKQMVHETKYTFEKEKLFKIDNAG